MSRKETKREKAEREFAILREPETLEVLCAHIADRGTLSEWCKLKDIRYRVAYEWLHDQDHGDRLEKYTRAMEARHSALSDLVISGLRDSSAADMRKLFDSKGRIIEIPKLGDDMARVVSEYSEEEAQDGTIKRKVKIESRKGANELLGRALGLYRDRIEHEGKLTLEELVGGSHNAIPGTATPASGERDPSPNPRSASKPKGL